MGGGRRAVFVRRSARRRGPRLMFFREIRSEPVRRQSKRSRRRAGFRSGRIEGGEGGNDDRGR